MGQAMPAGNRIHDLSIASPTLPIAPTRLLLA